MAVSFRTAPVGDEEPQIVRAVPYTVREEENRGSIAEMIGLSVYKSFKFLFREPVVSFFS